MQESGELDQISLLLEQGLDALDAGRLEDALASWNEILALDPEHARAAQLVASLHELMSQPDTGDFGGDQDLSVETASTGDYLHDLIERFRLQLEQSQAENALLGEALRTRVDSLHALEAEAIARESAILEARARYVELERRTETIDDERRTIKRRLVRAEAREAELTMAAELRIRGLEDQIAQLREQLAGLEGVVEAWNALQVEYEAVLAQREELVAEMEQRAADTQSVIDSLGEVTAKLSEFENAVEERDALLTEAYGRVEEMGQAVRRLEGELAQSEQKTDAVVAELHGVAADLATARQTIVDLQAATEALERAIEEARSAATEAAAEAAARQQEIATLQATIAERDAELHGLREQIAERDAELNGLREQSTERDAEIARLSGALARVGEEQSDAERAREALERSAGRATRLEHDLAARDARIEDLRSRLAERDARIDELDRALDEARGQLAARQEGGPSVGVSDTFASVPSVSAEVDLETYDDPDNAVFDSGIKPVLDDDTQSTSPRHTTQPPVSVEGKPGDPGETGDRALDFVVDVEDPPLDLVPDDGASPSVRRSTAIGKVQPRKAKEPDAPDHGGHGATAGASPSGFEPLDLVEPDAFADGPGTGAAGSAPSAAVEPMTPERLALLADRVPRRTEAADGQGVRLSSRAAYVLTQIDGQTPIADLVDVLGLPAAEASAILGQLLHEGLVSLDG